MYLAPSSPEPDAGWAADVLHFRGQLREMADIGAELARMALEQARERALALADASAVVERVSRTARRCMLLAQRLGEPVAARPGAGVAREVARRRILREVEDSIVLDAEPGDVERLRGEMLERLDAPELEDDIAARPVSEIIADIRRDLGLSWRLEPGYWNRRRPAAVAALCARAALRPGGLAVAGRPGGLAASGAAGVWSTGGGVMEPEGEAKDLSQMTDAELDRLEVRQRARWREEEGERQLE